MFHINLYLGKRVMLSNFILVFIMFSLKLPLRALPFTIAIEINQNPTTRQIEMSSSQASVHFS